MEIRSVAGRGMAMEVTTRPVMDRDFRERERHPPRPPLDWRVKEVVELTQPTMTTPEEETEQLREPRSAVVDPSLVARPTGLTKDVRCADFATSMWFDLCENVQSGDDAERDQLMSDSRKRLFELRTPISNLITVTGVRLSGNDSADRLQQILNEELSCDVKEVKEEDYRVAQKFGKRLREHGTNMGAVSRNLFSNLASYRLLKL